MSKIIDTDRLKTFLSKLDSRFLGKTAKAADSDKLDGIHASGLFTALTNSGNNISVTIGGTNKTITPAFANASKELNLQWGGSPITNASPMGMAISNLHNANRLAFSNTNGIMVERCHDYTSGNPTWEKVSIDSASLTNLVSGGNAAIQITNSSGSKYPVTTNDALRITLAARTMGVYTRRRKLMLNVATGNTAYVIVESAMGTRKDPNNENTATQWTKLQECRAAGWSGWNEIPLDGATFGGGSTQTTNNWYLRLTFYCTAINTSTTESYKFFELLNICLFGDTYWSTPSTMARTGHLYTYDSAQNATFPGKVKATSFDGKATSAATADSVAWSGVSSKPAQATRWPAFSEVTSKPTTLSGYGITDGVNAIAVSGSGNAVTSASVNGHTLTLTKGTTFLTSHQSLANYSTLANTIKALSVSGKTITYTKGDGTTGTITTQDTNTTYSAATTSQAGLMSATDKSKLDGIASGANNYSLPTASSTTKGGITLGYTQSGKNYPVQLDSNGKAYVNVGWTDTVYSLTKAKVEAVLTGNVTSHTHSQYLTSHQNISGKFDKSGGTINGSVTISSGYSLALGTLGCKVGVNSSYLYLQTYGNEMCIGGTSEEAAANMYVNYRSVPDEAKVPKKFIWAAGSSESRADFEVGALKATGNITAPKFVGALQGNAATATTLQTARTINGTSFNGSANITTANWGTARTLTIGNSGKSVNGSANVSWSLAEIGALPKSTFDELFEKVNIGTTDAPEYAIKAKLGFYSTKWVSALGANSTMSTGGTGGAGNLLQAWSTTMTDDDAKNSWALSAFLGKELNTRLTSLEDGSATSITTTGSGNAVTSITKNGATITVTKGATFLTSHQSLASYSTKADTIKALSVSGRTITYTKADGTTGTITTQDTTYSLPTASTTTKGGIMLGYTASGKNYPVQLDSSGKAYVSVAWTDTVYSLTKAKVEAVLTGNVTSHTHSQYLTSHQSLANYSTLANTIKALSVSGRTITYTKGDGTTGTITTQDTNTTYSAATTSQAGLMSATDKSKLDGIASGANNYSLTKAKVEAVLTGNVTSHTHSQYLTSHQNISGKFDKSGGTINGSVTISSGYSLALGTLGCKVGTNSSYLYLQTYGNEMCIGGTSDAAAANMWVNYRSASGSGYAPQKYTWCAGSGTSRADFDIGDLTANNGTFSGTVRGNVILQDSDRELKKDIEPIPQEVLADIDKVQLTAYRYKGSTTQRYGVIAQDVEAAGLGELVSNYEHKAVDYTSLLVLKIKSLENKVEQLESLINEMRQWHIKDR